jgi:hypothetical protein
MDQDIFRKTYQEVNERFCAYEKSILTNRCDCSRAQRFCIAEREGVHCRSDAAQAQCLELLELLRRHARFVLRATTERTTIPHGKAMKVQVGGLKGIKAALAPDQPVPQTIDDIHTTIEAARERFGNLESLPFATIMQQIAAHKEKQRSRRRTRT